MAAKVANAWSEDDDRSVIKTVVECVAGGMSKTKGIEAAAKRIGRTPGATSVRFYSALSGRFAEAIAEGAATKVPPEAPEIPSADVMAASFDREVPVDPADLHGDDLALWRFLQQHRPKWPMTAGTDLDLIIGLGRGDKLPAIAADLGLDTEALQRRYRTLISRVQDARGNLSIDGGPRLIRLLRRIANIPAEAA